MLKAYFKAEPDLINGFAPYMNVLSSMARFSGVESWNQEQPPAGCLPCIVQGFTLYVGFDTALDVESAKGILSQKQSALEKEAQHLEKKLQNEAYKNAKPDQWQEDSEHHSLKVQEGEKLAGFLDLLV